MSLPQSPGSPTVSRKYLILSLILIIFAGTIVYANSINGQFLWDDESLIQYNPYVKDWSHLSKIFTSSIGSTAKDVGSFYRPIQTFSYLLDYSFWRLNVVGYHMVNLGWHVLVAICVFGLIQIIFENRKVSLLTALLFVTHPIHTEAVSYISGRADSLAAFFMLLSFILYLLHEQKRNVMILITIALSYFLALLSRENCLIFPLLVWFYHYALKRPFNKKGFIVLWVTLSAYIFWRGAIIGVGKIAQGATPTFFERLPGVFIAFTDYVRLLFFPFNLHMEYGGILFQFSEPKAIIGIILLAVLLIFIFRKKESDHFLFFAVGWFFITLFPSSNLVFPINAFMAEHWLYLPSIGFFLIIARYLSNLLDNQKFKGIAMATAIALLLFNSFLTVRQNRFWNNGINFYQKMLEYNPESSRLYNNLAKAYHDAGKNDDLIQLLESAIQLQPDNALAYNNLGNAYKGVKKFSEAKLAYKQAIKLDPLHAGPYYNLSTIYHDVDRNREDAVRLLEKAIELSPHFSKSYNKLGLIYLEQGEKKRAIELLSKALKLNPDDPEIYHNFGYIYVQTGDRQKAKDMYHKAIEVNPNYVQAYHDLAIIYASSSEYQKAIKYCDIAVAMGLVDQQLLDALNPYR